jgi:hypothetical protein
LQPLLRDAIDSICVTDDHSSQGSLQEFNRLSGPKPSIRLQVQQRHLLLDLSGPCDGQKEAAWAKTNPCGAPGSVGLSKSSSGFERSHLRESLCPFRLEFTCVGMGLKDRRLVRLRSESVKAYVGGLALDSSATSRMNA